MEGLPGSIFGKGKEVKRNEELYVAYRAWICFLKVCSVYLHINVRQTVCSKRAKEARENWVLDAV